MGDKLDVDAISSLLKVLEVKLISELAAIKECQWKVTKDVQLLLDRYACAVQAPNKICSAAKSRPSPLGCTHDGYDICTSWHYRPCVMHKVSPEHDG
jgi:hypothetical protein